jgi:hypothetical protein
MNSFILDDTQLKIIATKAQRHNGIYLFKPGALVPLVTFFVVVHHDASFTWRDIKI